MSIEVPKVIEPACLDQENACRFLNVSRQELAEIEKLPYFPEDCLVFLDVDKARNAERQRKHYTVEGLRRYLRAAIEETMRMKAERPKFRR